MKHGSYINNDTRSILNGFTLLELLVVISIISVLMAILFPVIRKARSMARRIVCQTNLKDISYAWYSFFNCNEGRFLQAPNINHDFGGWKGTGGYALYRPLNEFVGLSERVTDEKQAKLFRCPSDSGGILFRPPQEKAYYYFGNSYQTNNLLIGPDQIMVPSGPTGELHAAINKMLRGITINTVSSDPSRLLLVGDNNWVPQQLAFPEGTQEWHGKSAYYNLAFLDCHVEYLRIRKGLYITDEYTILPFKDLYDLAYKVQVEVEEEQ